MRGPINTRYQTTSSNSYLISGTGLWYYYWEVNKTRGLQLCHTVVPNSGIIAPYIQWCCCTTYYCQAVAIAPHLASDCIWSYLISFGFIWSNLKPYNIIIFNLIWSHVVESEVIWFHYTIWFNVIWSHVISPHLIQSDVISYNFIWSHLSSPIWSNPIFYGLILSYVIQWNPISFYFNWSQLISSPSTHLILSILISPVSSHLIQSNCINHSSPNLTWSNMITNTYDSAKTYSINCHHHQKIKIINIFRCASISRTDPVTVSVCVCLSVQISLYTFRYLDFSVSLNFGYI